MPITDITNPDVIKFLVENYEKTTRLRVNWNYQNRAIVKDAATLHREEKGYKEADILKEAMAAGMPTITRDNKVAARNRKLKPIRDGIIQGIKAQRKGPSKAKAGFCNVEEDLKLGGPRIDKIMLDVDPEQKEIIYKDIPVFGRKVYLKNRYKMPPEKKFYYTEADSWEYGWKLKESFFGNHAPTFGRVWRLTRDVQSLTGPQPDPPHYKSSEIPGPSKCLR